MIPITDAEWQSLLGDYANPADILIAILSDHTGELTVGVPEEITEQMDQDLDEGQ